jgi:hypothetical protein
MASEHDKDGYPVIHRRKKDAILKSISEFWTDLFNRVPLADLVECKILYAISKWLQDFFRSGYVNLRHTACFFAYHFMRALT